MSSRELIGGYVRERARLRVFVPLAVVMAMLGWTGGPVDRWIAAFHPIDFTRAAATALVLMLAFRVWDDLEDRSRDAREHPRRVTVVADSVALLVGFGMTLALLGVVLITIGPRPVARLGAVAAAALLLGAWYRLRRAGAS